MGKKPDFPNFKDPNIQNSKSVTYCKFRKSEFCSSKFGVENNKLGFFNT